MTPILPYGVIPSLRRDTICKQVIVQLTTGVPWRKLSWRGAVDSEFWTISQIGVALRISWDPPNKQVWLRRVLGSPVPTSFEIPWFLLVGCMCFKFWFRGCHFCWWGKMGPRMCDGGQVVDMLPHFHPGFFVFSSFERTDSAKGSPLKLLGVTYLIAKITFELWTSWSQMAQKVDIQVQ